MSDCTGCDGKGTRLAAGRFADGTDDRDVTCTACNGTGSAPCTWCGEPSREADGYCSDACKELDVAEDARCAAVVATVPAKAVRLAVVASELQQGDTILSIGGTSTRVLSVTQKPRYVEIETEFGNGSRGIGLHPRGERVYVERMQH